LYAEYKRKSGLFQVLGNSLGEMRDVVIGSVLLIVIVGIFIVSLFGGAFVEDDRVISGVQSHGFAQPVILSKSIGLVHLEGCSTDDSALYRVSAINPRGATVQLLVCAGYPFKGVTVRTP
jgi:hypothetical protein